MITDLSPMQVHVMKGTIVDNLSEGISLAELCIELGCTKEQFYRWCAEDETFLAAYKHGEQAAEAWWWAQGRKGMQGMIRFFDQKMWALIMYNRFGVRLNDRAQRDALLDKAPTDIIVTSGENAIPTGQVEAEANYQRILKGL